MEETASFREDQAVIYRPRLRPHIGTGRHILVIAQPKSGSTALCNILSEVTGWPVDSYADRSVFDFAFSTVKATKIANDDRVIHLHSLPTPLLRAWMAERAMIPVVLHRDIPQAIVSMYHHHLRSNASLSDRLRSLPYESGIEETAWMHAHWHVRFQREWRGTLCQEPGLWLDHAELFADPASAAHRALALNGFSVPQDVVESAVKCVLSDASRSNYHGSEGMLPTAIEQTIRRLMAD